MSTTARTTTQRDVLHPASPPPWGPSRSPPRWSPVTCRSSTADRRRARHHPARPGRVRRSGPGGRGLAVWPARGPRRYAPRQPGSLWGSPGRGRDVHRLLVRLAARLRRGGYRAGTRTSPPRRLVLGRSPSPPSSSPHPSRSSPPLSASSADPPPRRSTPYEQTASTLVGTSPCCSRRGTARPARRGPSTASTPRTTTPTSTSPPAKASASPGPAPSTRCAMAATAWSPRPGAAAGELHINGVIARHRRADPRRRRPADVLGELPREGQRHPHRVQRRGRR